MSHKLSFVVAGVLFATLFSQCTIAQEEGHEQGANKVSVQQLLAKAKVTLPQAIETALAARPGIACVAELEAATPDEHTVAIYEVMIFGKDQKVYEVQVDAVDRSVRSNAECADEEDVGELRALAGKVGKGVTLLGLVNSARSVLRGSCVRVEFVAKDKQALAVMCKGECQMMASFSLRDGTLQALSLKQSAKKHEADEEEGEEGEEGEEAEHGEQQEHAEATKKAKAGKGRSNEKEAGEHEEEEEGEEHEAAEHKPAPKKKGKKQV